MSAKILAIETATEACSAALLCDGEVIAREQVAPRKHNELILPMCDQLLSDAACSVKQLDAIAFGRGPGAFTGVRIATSVVQGIAYAQDLPVIPVSTLATLAQAAINVYRCGQVMPAIDARMEEIYWAVYVRGQNGVAELVADERVERPSLVRVDVSSGCVGVGSGWGTYKEILQERTTIPSEQIFSDALPSARETVQIAEHKFSNNEVVSADQAIPVYLRDNVTQK